MPISWPPTASPWQSGKDSWSIKVADARYADGHLLASGIWLLTMNMTAAEAAKYADCYAQFLATLDWSVSISQAINCEKLLITLTIHQR